MKMIINFAPAHCEEGKRSSNETWQQIRAIASSFASPPRPIDHIQLGHCSLFARRFGFRNWRRRHRKVFAVLMHFKTKKSCRELRDNRHRQTKIKWKRLKKQFCDEMLFITQKRRNVPTAMRTRKIENVAMFIELSPAYVTRALSLHRAADGQLKCLRARIGM